MFDCIWNNVYEKNNFYVFKLIEFIEENNQELVFQKRIISFNNLLHFDFAERSFSAAKRKKIIKRFFFI